MKNYKLGNFICELREAAGMDQKTLASLLGVSASAISQCENGGGIKTEKLFQLSELFGVTLDELLSGKRAEQPIAERLDDLYNINKNELQKAVDDGDYELIVKIFRRIKTVRERFEELIYKRIFAKITTDENTELDYLKRYYNLNLYSSKCFTTTVVFLNDNQRYDYIKETLLNAFSSDRRNLIEWELHKIFSLNINLHLQEILDIIESDERIETEQDRLYCFTTVFRALPTLSKDLFFSEIVYVSGSFNMKLPVINVLLEHGAKLLYPIVVKNMTHIDKDIVASFEGNVEYDRKLFDIAAIYQNNYINSFSFNDFVRLTYDEYQACIYEEGMQELVRLAKLWRSDKIAYWDTFKTVKVYRKQS